MWGITDSDKVTLKFLDWYKNNKRFKHKITMLGIFSAGYQAGLKDADNGLQNCMPIMLASNQI